VHQSQPPQNLIRSLLAVALDEYCQGVRWVGGHLLVDAVVVVVVVVVIVVVDVVDNVGPDGTEGLGVGGGGERVEFVP